LIAALSEADDSVVGIRLSRNYGHQSALLAGLFSATGDAVITVDADLQDDISVIPEMIEKYCSVTRSSSECAAAARRTRFSSATRRCSITGCCANWSGNHPKPRGLSLDGPQGNRALQEYTEVNLFLRGIVPLIGFRSTRVYYDRKERLAGQSKYDLPKMFRLALDGITSFSAVPLRFVSVMGCSSF